MAWQRRPKAGVGAHGALALLALALCTPGARGRALEWYSAVVGTEYVAPKTNLTVWSVSESGRFGDSSPKEGVQGLVGVPRAPDGDPEGCAPDTSFVVPGCRGSAPWVALVARGGCTFKDKVLVAARKNASAVVLYNEERYGNLTASMSHAGTGNIVVIMVSYPKGREIWELVQKGIPVKMTIGIGTRHVQEFISGQSVVFVAIAFITMMIISLAWLIFYYIQRFLYAGSQFGIQSHRKETKKVIGQLPLHTVKHGEKHIFHRICIDPWLLDHRTCPMCKLDVIKALRYWGEPEDVQETPAPESRPGRVLAANLSLTVSDDDRSDGGSPPSAPPAESEPPCDASFKGDAGENTALLEAGRSAPQHGRPVFE
uniref:Ring finger protein 149 n=1 Tax=Propithecus coquereli TaxID=379532 RepID=A0A2K6GXK8_PROCO